MVYAADLGSVATSVEVRILSKAKNKLIRQKLLHCVASALCSHRLRPSMAEPSQSEQCLAWRSRCEQKPGEGFNYFRNVAQFGSAYRLGRWGQEFESLHSDILQILGRKL